MRSRDEVDDIVAQWQRQRPELPTEAMEICGRLFRASRALGDTMETTYREFGIGRAEFDVLATLRRADQPSLTPTSLANSMMLSTGGMTGRLDRLERAGLVTRSPEPTDRRGLRITLTAEGRKLIDEAVVAGVEVQEHFLGSLTESQREVLSDALAALMSPADVR